MVLETLIKETERERDKVSLELASAVEMAEDAIADAKRRKRYRTTGFNLAMRASEITKAAAELDQLDFTLIRLRHRAGKE